MEHCYHALADGPSSYLEILDKLQKQTRRTVGSSFAASLEPLTDHQNVTSLKVVSATFLLICFLLLKESICKTRENVFYFTSKALLVLEIIKF